LVELLQGMLCYDNQKRLTLDLVIDSPWFHSMYYKLNTDKAALEKTNKSLF